MKVKRNSLAADWPEEGSCVVMEGSEAPSVSMKIMENLTREAALLTENIASQPS